MLQNKLKKRGASQKLVLPYPQSVTFAIVSRCFENKNNNCCETKMPFVYLTNGKQIRNLAILLPRHSSCSVDRNECVDHFFKKQGIFGSQQLLFLFSKHLDTMANVTDCRYGKTNFAFFIIIRSCLLKNLLLPRGMAVSNYEKRIQVWDQRNQFQCQLFYKMLQKLIRR